MRLGFVYVCSSVVAVCGTSESGENDNANTKRLANVDLQLGDNCRFRGYFILGSHVSDSLLRWVYGVWHLCFLCNVGIMVYGENDVAAFTHYWRHDVMGFRGIGFCCCRIPGDFVCRHGGGSAVRKGIATWKRLSRRGARH